MDAATRGARDAYGEAVGITLEYFSNKRNGANPLLSREMPKQSLLDRLTTLLEMSNAHVALPGSIGTLAEIFVSWNLLVSGGEKPLILLGEEWEQLIDILEQYTEIRAKDRAKIIFSRTAEDAFDQISRHVPNLPCR